MWLAKFLAICFLLNLNAFSENKDVEYQTKVEPKTLAKLKILYDPKNESHLKITYASFTPEPRLNKKTKPDKDLGYGFHVIKRLELKDELIVVNEHWPEHRPTRGILLPTDIRVKYLEKKKFTYDSMRMGWDQNNEANFWRRSRKKPSQMQVFVSAPESCRTCHEIGNFSGLYVNGPIDNDSIVQRPYFDLPLEKTQGFNQYLEYLETSGVDKERLQSVRAKLMAPLETFKIPNVLQALENKIYWLPPDYEVEGFDPEWQGVYWQRGKTFYDAVETTLFMKNIWWHPVPVIVP